jgi:translation initiation factor IF-1
LRGQIGPQFFTSRKRRQNLDTRQGHCKHPFWSSGCLRKSGRAGPVTNRAQQNKLVFTAVMEARSDASVSMSAEQPIEIEGTITTVLPGTMFRVVLDNKHEILAHISGEMRKNFVRLTIGDRVRLEMSPYDLTKARITYRLR